LDASSKSDGNIFQIVERHKACEGEQEARLEVQHAYGLPVSFQFHHTQMDGAHAGKFLANLQKAIEELR
jgi:pyruvate/2-oxoglutarate dehydrogenase complex dihydrolipoamide acyltransferase (E2) component